MSDELLVFEGVRWPQSPHHRDGRSCASSPTTRAKRAAPGLSTILPRRGAAAAIGRTAPPAGGATSSRWTGTTASRCSPSWPGAAIPPAYWSRPRSTPPGNGSDSRRPKIPSPHREVVRPQHDADGHRPGLDRAGRRGHQPHRSRSDLLERCRKTSWREYLAADWTGWARSSSLPIRTAARPFVLRPKTLAAYMAISAASSLYRRAKMRTCARCGSWFEFTRAHAQFCSVSCRTLAHDSRRT